MRGNIQLFTIPLDLERVHHFRAMAKAMACNESGHSHQMDLQMDISRQQAPRLDVN